MTGTRGSLRWLAVVCACALLGAACSDDDDAMDADSAGTTATTPGGDDAGAPTGPSEGACDATDSAACLLPWPSDALTRADDSTPTGRRLDLPADGTPDNVDGVHIEPTEWNRSDGFSPSSIGLTVMPHLDADASGLPPQTDIGRSLDEDSPVVVLDVDTGERLAAWAEIDSHVPDPEQRLLRIVPAAGLPEGHRIAIALRDLKAEGGGDVEPSEGFAALVEDPTADQQVWLDALEEAGLAPDELTLAWSFTVASADGLSGRLRHMWEETSSDLGDGAPPFSVTSVEASGLARIVRGTFEMPKYLQGDGGPGSVLNNDDDPNGIPTADGTMSNDFLCTVPVAATGDDPAPFVVYGHGLLGSRAEVLGIGTVGAAAGIGFCALDYLGMSTSDVPTVIEEFADLTRFRTQPDRLQQGHLGFLLLGRLLRSAGGFGTDPAFQDEAGLSIVAGDELALLGASQGGILGGAATALTTDWDRAILAVGGMGYNLLLRRSIDFDKFAVPFEAAYTDPLEQAIAIELIQVLWDRGENTAYAQHLTRDPLGPRKEPSTVMLLEAFGDHQVANVATEKLARTLGIGRRAPTLAEGRSTDVDPFFGIEPLPSLPHEGSGLVVWDFDTPAPPASDTPPREGDDPHGKLSDVPEALALVAAFIQPDGGIVDVCNGAPCHTPDT